jgi:hypothetical protein
VSDYSEHARLSPSGSKKWMSCAGSLTLEAPIPNRASTYSDDGTAMHEVAAWCLTEHWRAVKRVGESIKINAASEEPRFVEFDDEMADLVQGYVDTVRALGVGNTMLIEQRVDFSEFVQVPEQFGTGDCIIVDDKQGELMVIDLKTGHMPVDVEKNSQNGLYALGALRKLLDEDLAATVDDPFAYAEARGIKTVRFGIYQPKVYAGLREWVCTLAKLKAFANLARSKAASVENAAHDFGRVSMDEWERTYLNPDPNEKDCAFCRAMPICPAAARKAQKVIGADFDVVAGEDFKYDLALAPAPDLSSKMKAAPFLEQFSKAVRAEVERRLLIGEAVPDFGLELGRKPPRKWTDLEAAEDMLRKKFRVTLEDAFNMKLKSPPQIEAACDPKKNETPVLGPRQWEKLKVLIKQGEPSPSVKPASAITKPYVPPKPDASAFGEVPPDDGSDLV